MTHVVALSGYCWTQVHPGIQLWHNTGQVELVDLDRLDRRPEWIEMRFADLVPQGLDRRRVDE